MASEVDKCYLCDLLGDFEEFKDIKEKFDAQHECWKKQNESRNKDISKEKLKRNKNNAPQPHGGIIESEIKNDQIQELFKKHANVFEPKQKNQERIQVINPGKNSDQKNIPKKSIPGESCRSSATYDLKLSLEA